ncbi:hypothetical protein AVEN_84463-1 [Araneus ventricosus]|uniref:Major facilitator superfamily (MFS) profile domain-containing protein n=1 Tax=Araneus ventricosus TaxID=182803 RepID=A0A4Y2TLU1_ARAVE|nr:hypothetical protein AVEN_84463-1 [Araneus ventricosus]
MTNDDSNKDVNNTARKCYDNPACNTFKTLDGFPLSACPNRRKVTLSTTKEKKNSGSSVIQYRYIVALFGFFMYLEIDCYRIATSMSIVKMVNATAVNFKKNLNGSIDSCPLSNLAIEEFPEPTAEGEFNWSPQMQGYILSAGFLGYVASQIPAGLIAEAYGAKNVYLSGVLIASLAHLLCPFAAWYSCYSMIAMQLLRGVGQVALDPTGTVKNNFTNLACPSNSGAHPCNRA